MNTLYMHRSIQLSFHTVQLVCYWWAIILYQEKIYFDQDCEVMSHLTKIYN